MLISKLLDNCPRHSSVITKYTTKLSALSLFMLADSNENRLLALFTFQLCLPMRVENWILINK